MTRVICTGLLLAPVVAGVAHADKVDRPSRDSREPPLVTVKSAREPRSNADEAFRIGTQYDTGTGVKQDFATAFVWYMRAAQSGHREGMLNVAILLDTGRGVARNRAQAAHWYEAAARAGDGRAAYDLALMYQRGDGVPRDLTLAATFYQMASQHGIAAARRKLALLAPPTVSPQASESPAVASPATPEAVSLSAPAPNAVAAGEPGKDEGETDFRSIMLDRGVAADPVEFFTSLRMSARSDNPVARYDLAYCYENGIGVTASPVDAFVWYSRAASSPTAPPEIAQAAASAIHNLANRLSPDLRAGADTH